ncbi:MAG: hypothetical protein NTX53_19680 [candidate division WOR-3 bacterium]|nr:hypothetical protein [candidate division WOR-3 bacterium]
MVVGVLCTILTVAVAVLIWHLQERDPRVSAVCRLLPDGRPDIIECVVHNEGRGEAQNVVVSFNNKLLLDTDIRAAPHVGAEIQKSNVLPDPQVSPEAALYQCAFAVRIGRVRAKDSVRFEVYTSNPDNVRAAVQTTRIQSEMETVMRAFFALVAGAYPNETSGLDVEAAVRALVKSECYFTPAEVEYSMGRAPVEYMSRAERLADAMWTDVYRAHKKEFVRVFENRPSFLAPVLRIITPRGEGTYAIFPPYVYTFIKVTVPISRVREPAGYEVSPPVPSNYD